MFDAIRFSGARLLVGAALLLGSAAADAQRVDYQLRTYVGGGAAMVMVGNEYCDPGVVPLSGGGSISGVDASCTDEETSFNAFIGYQVAPFFAAEAGYLAVDGFEASGEVTHTSPGSPDSYTGSGEFSTAYVALIWRYPFLKRLAATGRLGLHHWNREVCGVIETAPPVSRGCEKTDDTDLLYGLGADLDLTDNFRVQATLTRYLGEETEVDVAAFNLVYLF